VDGTAVMQLVGSNYLHGCAELLVVSIGYNTVWSVLIECNEHNTRQTVLWPTCFMTTHLMAIVTQAYYRVDF